MREFRELTQKLRADPSNGALAALAFLNSAPTAQ